MNSDRMRTVQLNVCDSKEMDRAVEHVQGSLEDPEKGGCVQWALRLQRDRSFLGWALRALSGRISTAVIEGHESLRSSRAEQITCLNIVPCQKGVPTSHSIYKENCFVLH